VTVAVEGDGDAADSPRYHLEPAWNTSFADLVARSLNGVRLASSDAHPGLVEAISANLPGQAG